MNLTVPPERIKRFHLDGYPINSSLVFCPQCDWQQEPLTGGAPRCPDCGARLQVTHLTAPNIAEIEAVQRA